MDSKGAGDESAGGLADSSRHSDSACKLLAVGEEGACLAWNFDGEAISETAARTLAKHNAMCSEWNHSCEYGLLWHA